MYFQEHLKIKDLPATERPYEKLENFGAQSLSEAELLAIVIKTGTKSETSIMIAQRILKDCQDWGKDLPAISIDELMQIKGVGRVKAIQIKAVVELGRRLVNRSLNKSICIKSPKDVADIFMNDMAFLNKEHVKLLLLNTKNQVKRICDISVGTVNSSIVHPREVFCEAIKYSSTSAILVHNHPSGDPEPSSEDIAITKRLQNCGNILGVELLDHVIIGNKAFVSLKERNII